MDIQERRNVLVSCGPGLREYLEGELARMGYEVIGGSEGSVVVRGSLGVLYRILDHRLHREKLTFVSSNKLPYQMERHIDRRISSRLHMLHIKPLTGKDRRREKRMTNSEC